MEPVRVADVRYLNTAPLVEGLEGVEGLTLLPSAPAEIAGLLERGEADVGLASLIDAVRTSTPLAVLGAGMIGSDGPTRTVRLFSRVPFERIDRVHADAESHTSAVLCAIVLREAHGVRAEVVPFDARSLNGEGPEALLLIGDKVVLASPPADRYPHQLDLGEAWRDLTGLPMVFAAWMCRAEEADSERIVLAEALLDRQRRRNAARLPWLIAKWAAERRWPPELAQEYLGRLLRYEFDARAQEGATRFLEMAATMGLAPARALAWAGAAAPG